MTDHSLTHRGGATPECQARFWPPLSVDIQGTVRTPRLSTEPWNTLKMAEHGIVLTFYKITRKFRTARHKVEVTFMRTKRP